MPIDRGAEVPVARGAVQEHNTSVICGLREAMCECVLPSGHDGPHVCDAGCGGSWDFDASGEFVVVSLPVGFGSGRRRDDDW